MSNCPKCNSSETAVKDSRPTPHLNTIVTRRRRICLNCTERYTTYEVSKEVLADCGFHIDSAGQLEKLNKINHFMTQINQILAA